jgi:hypothetical protein
MASRHQTQLLPVLLAIFTGFGLSMGLPTVGQTQSSSQQTQHISLDFKLPKRGAPSSTAGGASRSFCVTGKTPLTVITPSTTLGLTTAARPTFFLYVPRTLAKSAEFVLRDTDENDVYRATVALAGTPGVVSITLPDSAPALEVNKDYRWFFSMICRPGDRLEDVFVSAWVQRVPLEQTVATALQRATLRDRPGILAEAGLWYDTLTALAELRQKSPNDAALTQNWTTLLQSVGLQQVSTEPLLPQNGLKWLEEVKETGNLSN